MGAESAKRPSSDADVALLRAVRGFGNSEPSTTDLTTIDELIAAGTSLATPERLGDSPLWSAAQSGRFDIVERLLAAGADPADLGWDEDFLLVAFGDVEALRQRLRLGMDLQKRDQQSRTLFLMAVDTGDRDKAELLLAGGAVLKDRGWNSQPATFYPIQNGDSAMFSWLLERGHPVDVQTSSGATALSEIVKLSPFAYKNPVDLTRVAFAHGADPHGRIGNASIVNDVAGSEMIELFLEAGADPSGISRQRRELLGYGSIQQVTFDEDVLAATRRQLFGLTNPESIDEPIWTASIASGEEPGDVAIRLFGEERGLALLGPSPRWSYHDRQGGSLTPLSSGRWVEVAGASPAHLYDESGDRPVNVDHRVFNDVIVHDGNGGAEILFYPYDVFAPTVRHSATLVGDWIYIVGGAAHIEDTDLGHTPVHRLSTRNWVMERVQTEGEEPGSISHHRATLADDVIVVVGGQVEQLDRAEGRRVKPQLVGQWRLDLTTATWSRVSDRA